MSNDLENKLSVESLPLLERPPKTPPLGAIILNQWVGKLLPSHFVLLYLLHRYAFSSENPSVFISLNMLQSVSSLTRSTIVTGLNKLEQLNLIKKVKSKKLTKGGDSINQYIILGASYEY